jgi:Flp pilus assembly pilin Flp
MTIFRLLRDFHEEESGQGFVEYLLIVALIGLAVIFGLSTAANYVNNAFTKIGSKVSNSVGT